MRQIPPLYAYMATHKWLVFKPHRTLVSLPPIYAMANTIIGT